MNRIRHDNYARGLGPSIYTSRPYRRHGHSSMALAYDICWPSSYPMETTGSAVRSGEHHRVSGMLVPMDGGTEQPMPPHKPGSDPAIVISRRALRRVALIGIAVLVVAAIGTGAFLIGRSSSSGPSRSSSRPIPAEPTRTVTFAVPSSGMEPAIMPGDRVVVDRAGDPARNIIRGSIVVFSLPALAERVCATSSASDAIMRVIGLPGERISSQGNTVMIDGEPLAEPWLPAHDPLGMPIPPTTVPPHDYYVLGDNRADSCDSRAYGPLPRSRIFGKVVNILGP